MKIRKIASIILLAASGTIALSAQKINPMTQAVLQSYNEIIQANPSDYGTLYERAVLYFQMGRYDDALNDLTRAISATPAKDRDMLSREYSLYADVCVEEKDYTKALETIDKALELNPDSYADVYRKGNILMHLNRPEEAYRSYSKMQQFKSRSQEAYFGMAKACIAMGRTDEAERLIKEAENAAPNDYITYCRIGDLYTDLGSPQNAAANYLSAFALAQGSEVARPLQSLLNGARKDFASVNQAIDFAIERTQNRLPLLFVKSNLAYESGNYQIAYDAFNELLSNSEAQEASVYAQLARTCLALGKTEEALTAINNALMHNKIAEYYNIKSEVALARKDAATALQAAKDAQVLDQYSLQGMINESLALMEQAEYDAALQPLNEAIMIHADSPIALLLRANLLKKHLGKESQAKNDYSHVGNMEARDFPNILYKALAKAWNGRQMDADAVIEEAIAGNPSASDLAYVATYYAEMGDLAKIQALRARTGGNLNLNTNDPAVSWIAISMK